jgi:hypothetical protein
MWRNRDRRRPDPATRALPPVVRLTTGGAADNAYDLAHASRCPNRLGFIGGARDDGAFCAERGRQQQHRSNRKLRAPGVMGDSPHCSSAKNFFSFEATA